MDAPEMTNKATDAPDIGNEAPDVPATADKATAVPAAADKATAVPAAANEPDPRAVAAERLTFFADAVIAIAITLLALELTAPASVRSNHELLQVMYGDRDKYIAFVISFYVIGNFWSHHHKVFRYVTVLGGRLVFLSLLWLFLLVLVPFAARILSGEGAFQVRFVFYAAIQALAGLVWVFMVAEIQRNRLHRPDMPRDLFTNAYVGSGSFAAGFLLSIPVAFFTTYAYDLWFAVPVAAAFVRRLLGRRAARLRNPAS